VIELLLVGAGGAAGGAARLLLTRLVDGRLAADFPWGTLFVNLSGALLIGALAGWSTAMHDTASAWPVLAVGVIGSYTTVSAFSLQTVELFDQGRRGAALINAAATVGGCLALAAAGFALAALGGA